MDNDPGWVVLRGPPILAGGIAISFALGLTQPIAALNRGLYITWGRGIVLGFVTGAAFEMRG